MYVVSASASEYVKKIGQLDDPVDEIPKKEKRTILGKHSLAFGRQLPRRALVAHRL